MLQVECGGLKVRRFERPQTVGGSGIRARGALPLDRLDQLEHAAEVQYPA